MLSSRPSARVTVPYPRVLGGVVLVPRSWVPPFTSSATFVLPKHTSYVTPCTPVAISGRAATCFLQPRTFVHLMVPCTAIPQGLVIHLESWDRWPCWSSRGLHVFVVFPVELRSSASP